MKVNKKLKMLLLSIIAVLGLSIGLTPESIAAAEGNGSSVTVSVEKFSLGQDYIVEPVEVLIDEGDTAAEVVTEILGEGSYRHTGTVDSSFYLSGVFDPESAGEVDTIPQYILNLSGPVDPNTNNWLEEFDFTFFAGWKYAVNDVFPGYGLSDYDLEDGDVLRVQFTLYGFGIDLDVDANKDNLTSKIAEINSAPNKAEILAKPGVQAAYDQAYATLTNLESSQAQVDEASANLTSAIEADIEAPVISLGDVATEHTVEYGAAFVVPALSATDNIDEIVEVTTTITDASGNYLDTLNTKVPGVYTITYSAQDASGNQAEPVVLTVTITEEVDKALERTEQLNKTMAYLLETVSNPSFGTGAGEWTILALARSGYDVPGSYYDLYYENIEKVVNELMPASDRVPEGRLDRNKGSEHSRLIIALTALGKDVTDVGHNPLTGEGYNVLEALADYNFMVGQGINGPVYALIALDTNNYDMPQVVGGEIQATRQMYLDYILEREKDGGGWALFGTVGDIDITGMALQALAPYYHSDADVKEAADRAIAWLSSIQKDHGGFEGQWNGYSSESVSQVVIALTGLGIDIETDVRFIKSGNTLMDSLMTFAVPEGGFKHYHRYNVDGMATDQAAHALVAYQRLAHGQDRLYDMAGVFAEPELPEPEPEPEPELELPETDDDKLAELLKKLENIESQYASIIEQNSSLQDQINSLNNQITALQDENENSAAKIAALEARLAELEQAVTDLEADVVEEDTINDNQDQAIDEQSTDGETASVGETEQGSETEENAEELPSTGATDNAVWTMIGILLVGTGLIFIRKKQTN